MSNSSSSAVGTKQTTDVHQNFFVIAIDPRGKDHTKLSGALSRTAADQQAKGMQVNDRSRRIRVGEYRGANFERLKNIHDPK